MYRLTSLVLLASSLGFPALARDDAPAIRVDPRLLAQSEEVWKHIAREDNRVWPGWDASDTPRLFYRPGEQDVLIGHPAPPAGFLEYRGDLPWTGAPIFVRDDVTFFDMDGQNTARPIEGVETLVVADTLSNLRQRVGGLLHDPRPAADKVETLKLSDLNLDAYEQMAMIAHEAFHVYQNRRAPNRGADESALRFYPTLSVVNNVGFALESDLLLEALSADSEAAVRDAALRWLAVRAHRRTSLPSSAIPYEDEVEFSEGLAKFVELKLFETLEGSTPSDALWWSQEFRGFDDLSWLRDRRLDDLRRNLTGEQVVNNDRYGTAPLRFRLYYSGMGIAALLDALGTSWREDIFRTQISLTDLVHRELAASDEVLKAALERAWSGARADSLIAEKRNLAEDGEAEFKARLASILQSDATVLVIDYSALPDETVGLGYTPFGLTRLDDDRTIYTMVPVSVALPGGFGLQQTRPSPLLHDRAAKTLTFALSEKLGSAEAASAFGGELGEDAVPIGIRKLPGVTLKLGKGHVSLDGRRLRIVLSKP
ncbi:MAG: hypothetical protein RL885_32110 [Planctomycetota bacterium]